MGAGGDQLAIDDCGLDRQRENRRGDRREPPREVAAVSAQDSRAGARLVKLHPPPVEFDLVLPCIAGRRRGSKLGQGGRDELNARHSTDIGVGDLGGQGMLG
jgi:hypothetical protein